ncbi:MAG: hypothetical protein K2X10_11365 [Hyphomicrobiales bacterium]|nr:hypothetical protein [Hyphomicrobiales bacterium]OQW81200.1 MAG: hypothetical protein BVN31_11745 [Proteobacteria bacterium ST_bin15]
MSERDKNFHDEQQAKAKDALEELARPGVSPLGSSLADAANRTRDHFGAADADQDDRIEVWGKRVARIAALGFVIWLIWSLLHDLRLAG